MTWVDWVIVIVMAASLVGGLSQGFFRVVCSLGGLLCGLVLGAWNYNRVATLLMPLVRVEAVADAIGFLLIALVVMGIAGILGGGLSKTMHRMGLGCLDRLAGGALGFLQGAVLVMLFVLVALAFFPHAQWLAEARLPRQFFGVCHLSSHMGPAELADRVKTGLKKLEEESPQWLHPGDGGV